MDYIVPIVIAIIGAIASFAGAALAARNGFVELKTEFKVKQEETDRRIQKVEDKLDRLMEAHG